jgi:hypothetical protein
MKANYYYSSSINFLLLDGRMALQNQDCQLKQQTNKEAFVYESTRPTMMGGHDAVFFHQFIPL